MRKIKDIKNSDIKSFFIVIAFLLIASFVGYMFRKLGFSETNIVIVYILFVLLTARLTSGYIYGVISSVMSTITYNYFFTSPYFNLNVDDSSYIITFIIMTITAVITSALTFRVKQNAIEAEKRELETKVLFKLTNLLVEATEMHDIASISVKAISESISYKIGFLCFNENGTPERVFIQQINKDKQVYREVENINKIKDSIENLKGKWYEEEEFYDWPIHGREATLGILRIPKEISKELTEKQIKLLNAMLDSIALAMDRLREAKARIKSKEEMIQERYRSNLLRAISHDLRTPLSGIMGTSEILMDMTEKNTEEFELAFAIYKDADWLHSLVENILNLTKLQEGKLIINKEYEALEDLIGSAINYFSRRASKFEIIINVPEEIILIPADAKLIIQVIINLLDNAMKHSKESNEIMICAKKINNDKEVEIAVIDNGEGISARDLPNIFKMFYTSNCGVTDGKHGIGIGLNICESIIKAHNGNITAENRKDKSGAVFRFTLPMEG